MLETKMARNVDLARPVRHRLFLLSPASCSGRRCKMLLAEHAGFELARRVRSTEGAPLGEVFSFMSALYFRGKLAYARAFAAPPPGCPGALVITPSKGLLNPDDCVDAADIRAFGEVPIDVEEARYRGPLERDARRVGGVAGPASEVVLLGSIATSKYVQVLLEIFGARLVFPSDFVGRGDMSRGGLMLRAASSGTELAYQPIAGAELHGKRPTKLPRLPRRAR